MAATYPDPVSCGGVSSLAVAERDALERLEAPAISALDEGEQQRAWKDGLAMPTADALRYVTSSKKV